MAADLPQNLDAVAQRLAALRAALADPGGDRLQAEAAALQRTLAAAIGPLRRQVQTGALDGEQRRRIARLSAEVATQREALARAAAAADRALGVLLPDAAARRGYAASGHGTRPAANAVVRA